MKVVFVCDSWFSHRGGIQTVNRELAIALAGTGPETKVTCTVQAPSPEEVEHAFGRGVRLLRAGDHYLESVRFFQDEQPDFVVGHSNFTGSAACALAMLCGSQWIQMTHVDPDDNETWKEYRSDRSSERVKRWTVELDLCIRAAAVVCIGPRLARSYRAKLHAAGRGDKPLLEINCGFRNNGTRALPEDYEVLVLGRSDSTRTKGLDVAAAAAGWACRRLGAKRHLFRLRIRGGGKDADILEEKLCAIAAKVYKDGVTPIIVVPYDAQEGALTEDILRARVLLMPSRSEAFGLVAMEALSRGVPVIISDQSGVAELLRTLKLPLSWDDFVLPVSRNLEQAGRVWGEKLAEALTEPERLEGQVILLREALDRIASWEAAGRALQTFLAEMAERKDCGPVEIQESGATLCGPDGAQTAPVEYLIQLRQDRAENYALTTLAEEEYARARAAANEGDWATSYSSHLAALAVWRRLGVRSRIARSMGRLAWCLITMNRMEKAVGYLEEAAGTHPAQGAANYFWAAQYCFRAGQGPAATQMIDAFVRLCWRGGLVKLPAESIFTPTAPLVFLDGFYEHLIETEEAEGWADTTWSDRGRLCLVRAALYPSEAIQHTESARALFEKCGLSSYVAFCDGRVHLLRAAGSEGEPESRNEHLRKALLSFAGVSQRFEAQEGIMRCYAAAIESELAAANGNYRLALERLQDALPDMVFEESRIRVAKLAEMFADCKPLSRAGTKAPTFRHAYDALYRTLPDLEGYYLPLVAKALGEAIAATSPM